MIGYNIETVREGGAAKPLRGKRLKNFQKPLDKGEARWYNIKASLRGDPGGARAGQAVEKRLKNFQKPLDKRNAQ